LTRFRHRAHFTIAGSRSTARATGHRALGYPTYVLEIDGPGFSHGYVSLGRRNVSLPGQFVRSRDDGACWNNPQTNTKLCAW
jgi:hypothetical protein